MAFVSQANREINNISKTTSTLGPGQYFTNPQSPTRKGAAPFQTSNCRRSIFQPTGTPLPGPGDYENTQPFIQSNIKTVSNSQSIIVKINSTGTSQFKSLIDRFEEPCKGEEPGPGYYTLKQFGEKSRSKSKSKKYSIKSKQIMKIVNPQKHSYPAIPEKVRGLTDAKKQQIPAPQTLGPGCYDYKQKIHGNLTSTVWGKDGTKRFSKDFKSNVGPGRYSPEVKFIKPQDKLKQPYFAYKSSTVRTYFDSLFYQTNLSTVADTRRQSKFKVKGPAPGEYDTKISALKIQQTPFAFQFFGSSVQRFPHQQEIVDKGHKSFYNIKSEIGKNRSFNKGSHSFMNSQPRQPSFLGVDNSLPGPGHYKQKVQVEKKLKGVNLQQFGTTTRRPFYESQQTNELGPGKYLNDQNKTSVQKSRFGQLQKTSSTFRSITVRNCFGSKKNDIPFAKYDISNYDLSKKLQKQRNFIQNLKKIEVQRAPFQSSFSRFPHYERDKSVEDKQLSEGKLIQLRIKQQSQKARATIIEENRNQIYQRTQDNFFSKSQRFKSLNKGSPGAGHYNVDSVWQRKSHNIKYQK